MNRPLLEKVVNICTWEFDDAIDKYCNYLLVRRICQTMFMDWVISRAGAGINTLSILKYDNVSCIFLLQEKLRNIFFFILNHGVAVS